MLRPLVGLAVVEAVVEEEGGEGPRRHAHVEPREARLASAALDVVQVDEEGEVAVPLEPGLARVVVVVVRLVVLARAVLDRLQRLQIVLGVACELGGLGGRGVRVRGLRFRGSGIAGPGWGSGWVYRAPASLRGHLREREI